MHVQPRRAAIVTLLILGACAHAPRIETLHSGQWPAGTSFGIASFDAGEDAALRSRISACLAAKGIAPADKPALLAQIGVADHPPGSAVLLDSDNAGEPKKRRSTRWRDQSLTVSLSELSSGREVYRVRAAKAYRRSSPQPPLSDLAEAACQAMGDNPAAPAS